MGEQNNTSKKHVGESDVFTRRMFIKGVATSFGALPVFAWPRWAQAFYYNLGFFKKGSAASSSLYVEDVFSTYIYTGTGSSQTINNGLTLVSGSGWVTSVFSDSAATLNYTDGVRSLGFDSSGNSYAVIKNTILKLNSNNNIVWEKVFTGFTPYAAAVNSSTGDVIAAGSGSGVHQVVKFDTSGNIAWQYSLSGISPHGCASHCISVASSGNIYIGGYASDGSANYALLYKLSSAGVLQWQKQYYFGSSANVRALKLDAAENIYVAIKGGGPSAGSNAHVAKFDSSGNMSWCNSVTVPGSDTYTWIFTPNGLDIDSSGNVYCAVSVYSSKSVLVKLDSAGVFQWSRSFGSSWYGGCVAVDSSNNVYIATNDNKRTVVKFNTSGTALWKKTVVLNSDYALGQYENGGLLAHGDKLYIYGTDSDQSGASPSYPVIINIKQDGTSLNGNLYVNMSNSTLSVTTNPVTGVSSSGVTFTASAYTLSATSLSASSGTLTVRPYILADQPSTNAGMVWIKSRSSGSEYHVLQDTSRGVGNCLSTNATDANLTSSATESITAFSANGFALGVNRSASQAVNTNSATYSSWSFRKAAKFFDMVTWTGNGGTQLINHSLGTVPGMIVVKCTSTAADWAVWHRSLNSGFYILLNTDSVQSNNLAERYFGDNSTTVNPTSTNFRIGSSSHTNSAGHEYVAYLFAHDTAADGLIQCGSFTTDGAAKASINLGWEAQYVMMKRKDSIGNWIVLDQTRGWSFNKYASLYPNTSGSEQSSNGGEDLAPTSRGFKVAAIMSSDAAYIYIAIRRPMKIPTDATKVFIPIAYNQATNTTLTIGFSADMAIHNLRTLGNAGWIEDRLRKFASSNSAGASQVLDTNSTAAESNWAANNPAFYNFDNTQVVLGSNGGSNNPSVAYFFRRAPGFFDQVCYTGNQQTSAITVNHNLGLTPELIIIKKRNNTGDWIVKHKDFGDNLKFIRFNTTSGVNAGSTGYWSNTAPTATTFTVGTDGDVNGGGTADTFTAYLFASCPGVSKVGSFTGSASDVTVSCGFSGQPRFVLVKRTDAVGDWIVVDSARSTSVYLTLNTTNNEVAATVITFTTGGFVAKAGTVANAAGSATYIFMAIA